MILDYWATWVWDFPHLAVGLTEFILAFSFTHYATDSRPSVWKQPSDPAVHPRDWPTEEQCKRARIDPAIDDRMLWRGNNTMGYTQVEIPHDWRGAMKRKDARYLNRWQVTDD